MQIYTIPQKMSGKGNIHDLASDLYDRDIKFPRNAKYAVVLSAYYGGKGYTTHKTAEAALTASRLYRGYSQAIIDAQGSCYDYDPDNGLVCIN